MGKKGDRVDQNGRQGPPEKHERRKSSPERGATGKRQRPTGELVLAKVTEGGVDMARWDG